MHGTLSNREVILMSLLIVFTIFISFFKYLTLVASSLLLLLLLLLFTGRKETVEGKPQAFLGSCKEKRLERSAVKIKCF
jgi:hypothetical protein